MKITTKKKKLITQKKSSSIKKKKPKILLLFSGGLDSRIALKILQKQKAEIELIHFILPFGGGCCNNFNCVFNYTQTQGVKLHVVDLTKIPRLHEYLEFVKNPKHGYGTSMNPCRDCKIFMFKQAKKLAEKINADVIATGEVLSQRPMSQLKHQLKLTEKQAGFEILRPLSAKLLPETIYEKNKLIDRTKLLDIKGRNRTKQLELTKKYKIKYPSPGGGCLLCEKNYTPKLKDLLNHKPVEKIQPEEIQLLNIGRHFRNKGKIILGKNHQENKQLEQLNKFLNYSISIPKKIPGPTAIYENKQDKKIVEELIQAYSNKPELRKKFEKLKIISY